MQVLLKHSEPQIVGVELGPNTTSPMCLIRFEEFIFFFESKENRTDVQKQGSRDSMTQFLRLKIDFSIAVPI